MTSIARIQAEVSAKVIAGLLVLASMVLRQLRLPHPNVAQILSATGAGRSGAYEIADELSQLLPGLQRPTGRPAIAEPPKPVPQDVVALSQRLTQFLIENPGCVRLKTQRRHYTTPFRLFILELRDEFASLDLVQFAQAVHVPLPTLRDWLHPATGFDQDQPHLSDDSPSDHHDEPISPVSSAHLQTIIEGWQNWKGPFTTFCDHLRHNERLPYGRTFITGVLRAAGLRRGSPRPGRSPDEEALRGAFETFFPGAQWEADGTPLVVSINGQPFQFNLELEVDAASSAVVGASIRDEEDGQAVVTAFLDGCQTTGAPPLAQSLDNRPSNHTPEVDQALGDTIRIRTTSGRPQNNAHVEGSFGLFAQMAPDLEIQAASPKDFAAHLLRLVVQTWARTLNHRKRENAGGRSRVDSYREDQPTAQQVEQARKELEQRRQRQEQARQTQQARQDPVVRQVLDEAFERFDLVDPEHAIRDAIARYPLNAILAAIATFEGKQQAATLPDDADGRYLMGIARNITLRDEGILIAQALWQARLQARDHALVQLHQLQQTTAADLPLPLDRIKKYIHLALDTDRRLDRFFWLDAAADTIAQQPPAQHQALFLNAAKRIHAAFHVSHADRLQATRFLAGKVVPLT